MFGSTNYSKDYKSCYVPLRIQSCPIVCLYVLTGLSLSLAVLLHLGFILATSWLSSRCLNLFFPDHGAFGASGGAEAQGGLARKRLGWTLHSAAVQRGIRLRWDWGSHLGHQGSVIEADLLCSLGQDPTTFAKPDTSQVSSRPSCIRTNRIIR